ncbi:MAG: hypothetical protein R6W75_08705, partial [Smithellaceae bacterium]
MRLDNGLIDIVNSDGVSQADELHTLGELGITGLDVSMSNTRQTFPDGNSINGTGTYTKADGATGATADVYLKVDTANREFMDAVPVSPEVEALPDAKGSGLVRDLHEAASLSPTLQNLLTQYSQATTRNEQLALMDQLLYAWVDTSGMAATMDDRDPFYHIRYDGFGSVRRYDNTIIQPGSGGGSGGSGGSGGGTVYDPPVYVRDVENTSLTPEYRALIEQWSHKLHILEAFNGRYFFAFPGQRSGEGATAQMGMGVSSDMLAISFPAEQLTLLNQSYEALRESVYESLFYQTRFETVFAPLVDKIELVIGEDNSIAWDYSQLEQHFSDAIAVNAVSGMSDLLEFNRYIAKNSLPEDWKGNEIFADYCRSLPVTPELQTLYDSFGNYLHLLEADKTSYRATALSGEEVIASLNTATTIFGGSGDDVL